jgi:hypothetical protein
MGYERRSCAPRSSSVHIHRTPAPLRRRRRRRRSPAGVDSRSSRTARSPFPPPILAGFGTRPAHGHRAPRAGLIATVVVERPATMLAGASLETGPAAIQHRHGNDRCQQRQRRVEIPPLRLEVAPARGAQLHEQTRTAQAAIQALDGFAIHSQAVVGEQQGAQPLAHIESAAQVGSAETGSRREQVALEEPLRSALGLPNCSGVIVSRSQKLLANACTSARSPGAEARSSGCRSGRGATDPSVSSAALIVTSKILYAGNACAGTAATPLAGKGNRV